MITTTLATFAAFLYLIAMLFYVVSMFFETKYYKYLATGAVTIGVLLHVVSFIVRAVEFYKANAGVFTFALPVTNLYESLQFFSLVLALCYLVYEYKTKTQILGAIVTGIAGTFVLFASVIGASDKIEPLVPALQSNWLLAHVILSFIAYVCFALSAICAFIYLAGSSGSRGKYFTIWTTVASISTATAVSVVISAIFKFASGITISVGLLFIVFFIASLVLFRVIGASIATALSSSIKSINTFDTYTYKLAIIGFIIFTLGGLVFGAIWAEQAWGRYWSWDPKETWALITWAVYAIYLHRGIYSSNKSATNTLALIGFAVTIFTFLGVNLLLSGLHSYGGL